MVKGLLSLINPNLLTEFAEIVNGKIDRVVLNGVHTITDFEVKEVDGNTLAINYIVKESDVSNITKIELKGPDDFVSSHDVEIPIKADQVLIQEIEILEG